MKSKFVIPDIDTYEISMSDDLAIKVQKDTAFSVFVNTCLARYLLGDWGTVEAHIKRFNEIAIEKPGSLWINSRYRIPNHICESVDFSRGTVLIIQTLIMKKKTIISI